MASAEAAFLGFVQGHAGHSENVVIPAKAGIHDRRRAALVRLELCRRRLRHGPGARGFRLSPE
jgi:hypothetical protein